MQGYSGSVFGGLAQLLLDYYQAQALTVPEQLQHIQQQERFEYRIWRELLLGLEQQLQKPALGLDIAAYVQPRHLGIIAYLALSCESLGEALQRYHDFHRLIYDGSPLCVTSDIKYVSVSWEEPEAQPCQITDEIAIALMVEFLKHFMVLDQIHLYEVHFSCPAPRNIALYEQYFHCKVGFSQPLTRLLLPFSELSKPIKHSDQTLQHLLMQQAQALLEKLPHSTQLDQRLQQVILKGLQRDEYQIEQVAVKLEMSVRQLQRHLQQQGSTYQERVQHIRFMLARQYLKDPYLSLKEIALLLGYSEQSAFQRAFKHWTGQTPRQWRLYEQDIKT